MPDQRARIAVEVAMKQIGLPYIWGGNGPENGHRGFDCSGLTTFAYDKAGVELPRTAHTQFRQGPRVPDGTLLQPGDLVFYGTYRKVHHVGMYIGSGRMVNAPTFGKPVQTAWYRYNGDDYIGATRPAATGTGALPTVPNPAVPELPDPTIPDVTEFPAPPAPPLPPAPNPLPEPAPRPTAIAMPAPTVAAPAPVPTPAPAPLPEGRPDAAVAPRPRPTSPPTPTPTPNPPPSPPRPTPTTSVPTPPPTPTSTAVPPTTPVAPPTTPTASTVVQAVSLTDPTGQTHPATPVTTSASGLPTTTGSWAGPDRWVLRVAAALPAATPGAGLVLHLADGTTRTFTVQTTRNTTTAAAASTMSPLVVLAPAGPGEWVVTTAR
ncbi:secreted transglycosylase [Pseudonocardia sp. Ae717_Ps2]|uniref:C40 family peptidase n=1 Tax=unclassified Pseudonocardia TaxID=2619320 RepID=UPI00094E9A27|nr:secreted transglycosylase [Pseudonocardia sp. Ae717_Ps2]